jgi:hypothetical protein
MHPAGERGAALLDIADQLRGAGQDDPLFQFADAQQRRCNARLVFHDRAASDDRKSGSDCIVLHLPAIQHGAILQPRAAAQ